MIYEDDQGPNDETTEKIVCVSFKISQQREQIQ